MMEDPARDPARKVPSLAKLGKFANSKRFEDLEDAWPVAVAWPDYDPEELVRVARQVSRQGDTERANGMLEVLLGHLEETRGAAAALAATRVAAQQIPESETVRRRLRELYLTVFSDLADLPALLDLLLADDRSLDEAVELVDRYLQLWPGAYAADHAFLVPGRVEALQPANGLLTVRFDERLSEYGPETLGKINPLPEDHFPALVIHDPDRLRVLAEEDPLAFVLLALRSDREHRLAYRDLKAAVTRLLGEKGWKSWWPHARDLLRRAPRIAVGGGSQPPLRLLRQEDHWVDRYRRAFDRAQDPVAKLRQVRDALVETRGGGTTPEETALLTDLGNGAAKIAVAALADRPALALGALAVHAQVAARGVPVARPNPRAAAQVLARLDDRGRLPQDLPEWLLVPTLEYLRTALPDQWAQVWADVLLKAGKRVCDVVVRGLLEDGRTAELQSAVDRAHEHPTGSPDFLGWLWRTLHGSPLSKRLTELRGVTTEALLFDLLGLLASVGRLAAVSGDERHQKVIEGARSALTAQGGEPLRRAVEDADRDQAVRFKALLQDNAGVPPATRTLLQALLRTRYNDLFMEMARPWDEQGVIYTTDSGLRRRQEELEHIMREEIPEVARQIGEAASFGDLSENAEYTAALEKRDQITSRAKRIESELAEARRITPEMAQSSHVNIGTRVRARNLVTDEDEVYTFLGPWEADADRRFLNYRAPLALAFMGKRPGDEVVYGDADEQIRWRVEAVEPAL
ncbi:MAG: GreA/GreB family elongation factor [Candidatus Krumholzibacteriia bacterium]